MSQDNSETRAKLETIPKPDLIEFVIDLRKQLAESEAAKQVLMGQKLSIADSFVSAQTAATAIVNKADKESKRIIEEATGQARTQLAELEGQVAAVSSELARFRGHGAGMLSAVIELADKVKAVAEADAREFEIDLARKDAEFSKPVPVPEPLKADDIFEAPYVEVGDSDELDLSEAIAAVPVVAEEPSIEIVGTTESDAEDFIASMAAGLGLEDEPEPDSDTAELGGLSIEDTSALAIGDAPAAVLPDAATPEVPEAPEPEDIVEPIADEAPSADEELAGILGDLGISDEPEADCEAPLDFANINEILAPRDETIDLGSIVVPEAPKAEIDEDGDEMVDLMDIIPQGDSK